MVPMNPARRLTDEQLECSAVVANCRMNRERGLLGSNGYDTELGFNPLDFLETQIRKGDTVGWLDLCCGSGKALIEASRWIQDRGWENEIELVGVDLVGMFALTPSGQTRPRLLEASWRTWRPDRAFNLITCVHGLHYVGDKLGLMARAVSWLTANGEFVASLDLANLRLADGRPAGRRVAAALRQAGLSYDRRRRLVRCRGKTSLELPLRYLGADDQAGPNSTGQPAVNSFYSGGIGESRGLWLAEDQA